MNPSDEELFARYVAGEEAAFEELFARYAPRLTALFRRQAPGEADVQDLLQQTFLQLHRARHDFRPGSELRPWLITIALNLLRRHYRRRSRAPGSLLLDPAGEAPAPSAGLEGAEQVSALERALRSLPAQQREVIELHWYQGLPFAQVARQVGASLSAVKVRAHRGYKRLRELLQVDGSREGARGYKDQEHRGLSGSS